MGFERGLLIEQLKPIKAFVHTLTANNGKEFAYHQMVSFELETDFTLQHPTILGKEGSTSIQTD